MIFSFETLESSVQTLETGKNLKFPYLSSNLRDEKPHSMHHCQWGKNFIKLFSWVVIMYQTITSGMLLFYYMHDPLHYLEQKFTQTTCVVLTFWTITSQMSLCNCMCNPLCYVKQRLHFITDFIISPLKCFSDT